MFGLTPKMKEARKKIKPFETVGPSRTKQEFTEESSIRVIMERMRKYGVPIQDKGTPVFGDVSNIGDFTTSINTAIQMNQQFANLVRSDVRKIFDNDPEKVYNFIQDPKNKEKAIEYGLLREEAPAAPEMAPKETSTSTESVPSEG